MNMNSRRRLLHKLFNKQISVTELKVLTEILRSEKTEVTPQIMEELFQQIGEIPEVPKETSDKIFEEVMGTIHDLESEPEVKQRSSIMHIKKMKNWITSAAAVLLLVLGSIWAFDFFQPDNLIVKESALGEIKEYILPDGSLVSINGNSKLSHAAEWKDSESRVVHLEGEAFFEVLKIPSTSAKFKVITDDLTVEVLGTSFNVYNRKSETKVYLEEGKVDIHLDHKATKLVQLNPGQAMAYSSNQKILVSPEQVESVHEVSWKDGFLQFKKESTLKDILERLSETNNVNFEIVGEQLGERTFALTLPIEDLEHTLSVLSVSTGTTITKNGNYYKVRPKSQRTKK